MWLSQKHHFMAAPHQCVAHCARQEPSMNRQFPRIAALSLCLIAGLSACSNNSTPATGKEAGATAATEAGNKVAAQITGAGASFVYPLISKWSADYAKATGNKVNYQSIGSGGGIAQI